MIGFGLILFVMTVFKSKGVVTVSTSQVVIVILCDQRRSKCKSALTPCTPIFAIVPPAATISSQSTKVSGIKILQKNFTQYEVN